MTLAIFPLQFEEEDVDIWEALALVEPGDRPVLVKEALRQYFRTKVEVMPKFEEPEVGFKLENLLVQTDNHEPKSEKVSKPWEHLLQEVIGLEEDESVIKAIRAHIAQGLDDSQPIDREQHLDQLLLDKPFLDEEEQEWGYEPKEASPVEDRLLDALFVEGITVKSPGEFSEGNPEGTIHEEFGIRPVPALKGIAHLLNVIGEEEDETLVALLKQSS